MKETHWIIKTLKYDKLGIILAFLGLLFSLSLGVIIIYSKLNGWWVKT